MNGWKLSILVLPLALGASVLCPACGSGEAEGDAPGERAGGPDAARLAIAEYDVRGMTCGGCALATKAALARLDGVVEADAGYEKGTGAGWARVEYDPERVTSDQIAAAIADVGFEPVPEGAAP